MVEVQSIWEVLLSHFQWINDEIFTDALVAYMTEMHDGNAAPDRGFMPGFPYFLSCARQAVAHKMRAANQIELTPERRARIENAYRIARERGWAELRARQQRQLGTTDG